MGFERGRREREREVSLEKKKKKGEAKKTGACPRGLSSNASKTHRFNSVSASLALLTLPRSLGSVVTSTSLHSPLPVTLASAPGGGAKAERHSRETILAVTALSSTPVLFKISRSRSSPRSEMFVGGTGGSERAVGVAPRGVEQEEEALLTSPRARAASASTTSEEEATLTLAESPFSVAAGLHEVASGLSGVGGPERRSEAFISGVVARALASRGGSARRKGKGERRGISLEDFKP